MKRLQKKAIIDTKKVYDSWNEFENELTNGTSFEPFEEYYVPIEFKNYLIAIEGWYPDCLESTGLGETNLQNIKANYLSLMENQFGFKAEKHSYLPDSNLSEYGVVLGE
jgi:hypothetical protein